MIIVLANITLAGSNVDIIQMLILPVTYTLCHYTYMKEDSDTLTHS